MNKFEKLVDVKKDTSCVFSDERAKVAFVADLGARVFCELDGQLLHRLDIDNVKSPDKLFNNYGGNNFWPAPEGGIFGFNYDGDTWRVQTAINDQPFLVKTSSKDSATFEKQTKLVNRKGKLIDVTMQRAFSMAHVSGVLKAQNPKSSLAYIVEDRIDVLNKVKSRRH